MTRTTRLIAMAVLTCMAAVPAGADERKTPVINSGFGAVDVGLDTGALLPFEVMPVDGWTPFTEDSPGVVNPIIAAGNFTGVIDPTDTSYFNPGPFYREAALIYLVDGMQPPGASPVGLRQTVPSVILKSTLRYRLYASIGNIATDEDYLYDLGGFPGYAIQLAIGDTILVEDRNSLVIGEGDFVESVIEFEVDPADPTHMALMGEPIEIRLLNLNLPVIADGFPGAQFAREVDFDNVMMSIEEIPEP